MKRHLPLILLRSALAAGIVFALPYSHRHWGEPYPGEGQKAFGMILLFTGIGAGFAVLYVAAGGAFQYFTRRKSWWWTAVSDLAIFVLLAGLLVYGGITARYSDTGGPGASPQAGPAEPSPN